MRVYVLMSTYNGARYVDEQLRSILVQLPPEGRIQVRDDGSTDDTVRCIEAIGDPRIEIQRGQNIGFAASFLTLLHQAPANADMVMFADQDDVWLPFKIDRAWRWLQPHHNTATLYCSAQMVVDERLQPLQHTPPWPRPPSFKGAVGENIVTGCTAALNAQAVRLLKEGGIPLQVRFHDWWMYLVVSAFGVVLADEEATLLYRQHGGNQIGRGAGWWGRHIQMIRFLIRNDWVGILLGQIAELRRQYGPRLSTTQLQLLDQNFLFNADGRVAPRWSMILGTQRWRQSLLKEFPFRALLLLRRLRNP